MNHKSEREWDNDKNRLEHCDIEMRRSRSRSPGHRRSMSLSKDREHDRSRSWSTREARERNKGKNDEESPAKHIDDLSEKTNTTPMLPLTDQQRVDREKIRVMRPMVRQKQGGGGGSPIRELNYEERDRSNIHRGSVPPPRRAPEHINYYKGDEIPIPAPTKKTNSSVNDKQEEEIEEHMELAQKKRETREASTERRRIARELRWKERMENEERTKEDQQKALEASTERRRIARELRWKERLEKEETREVSTERRRRNLNNPKSVREWDKDKKRRKNRDITTQRSRSMSPSRTNSRALSNDRKQDSSRDRSTREAREKNDKGKKDEESPAQLLDDLFEETNTTPMLPLTDQQRVEREKIRVMRPMVRQKQEGDGGSPMKELNDEERDRSNIHRGSVPPPRRAPEHASTSVTSMLDDDNDDVGMTQWGDRDTDQKLASVNLRQTAIDITADDLEPRLSHINVMDLVIISMVMLPDSVPTHFKTTHTPISSAGTEGQISHMARLLATQLTTAGLGKGLAEVQSEASTSVASMLNNDDDEVGMTQWGDRDTDQKLASVNLRQTAIGITADYLAPRLNLSTVTDLVIISMVMLPDSMPTHFHATHTPIASAGTDGHVHQMARLLVTQLTTAGLGKGVAEVQREINYYKGDEIPIPAPNKKTKPSVKDKQAEERQEHMELAQKTRETREASTERRRIARELRWKERRENKERMKEAQQKAREASTERRRIARDLRWKERLEKEERNLNNPKSVREWDNDKTRRKDRDIAMQRSRSMPPSRTKSRSLLNDRKQDSSRDRSTREAREKNDKEPSGMSSRQDPSAQQTNHNYKLIVDPEIHEGRRQKIYRCDGIDPVEKTMIPVIDPRPRYLRFWSEKVPADLHVPKFKIDEWDVSGISQVYLHSCITKSLNENYLIIRDKSLYPLELVPLFNVDGPNQGTQFPFKESCDRLIKEMDKLVTQKPKCYHFCLEKGYFAEDEILTKYKDREISEEDKTISALCWFKKGLLPEEHKGTSIENYVNLILNHMFLYYRHTDFFSEPTTWKQSNMKSDFVVLYLNMKMQKSGPNLKDVFRDMRMSSKFRPTFTKCSSETEAEKLEKIYPLRVDLYKPLEKLFSNLIRKIKDLLPRPDSTFKSVNFTIGKSSTRQKTDKTVFDSCDYETWDTTHILSRWTGTYDTKIIREKNQKYGAYAAMIVLCVVTPDMVPKHLRVKRKEDLKKGEKETTRSIQELFALTIERTLILYFQYHPISKEVRIKNKEQNNPGPTGDFHSNGVVYLAYNRNTWLYEEEHEC